MNKKEFVDAVSEVTGFSKRDSEHSVNAVIHCITELLANGDSLVLPGFASISVKKRAARTGRNPATGKPLKIPATNAVSFKAGTRLKEAVNSRK